MFHRISSDVTDTLIQVSHTHPIQLTPNFDTYKVLPLDS